MQMPFPGEYTKNKTTLQTTVPCHIRTRLADPFVLQCNAMETVDLTAMLLLGLLGTGHCVGMCGPLVIAFPGRTGRVSAHLAYHAGRLATYTLLGALVGLLGGALRGGAAAVGADPLVWVVRSQVALSAAAAVFLLLFGLSRLGLIREPEWLAAATPSKVPGAARLLRRTLAGGGNRHLLGVGLLLGLLPCGLSYAALARSLAAGSPGAGMAMMAAFGAGTLPGLLALGFGAGRLFQRWRRQSDLIAGMIMLAMAARLLADALVAWA
jgi:sulfite exporter TauE/SafE